MNAAKKSGREKTPQKDRPLTRSERKVLGELRRRDGPVKAYALLRALEADGLHAPASVYRPLAKLIERGLVRKIASLKSYIATPADETPGLGAIVVCRRCGRAVTCVLSREDMERLFAAAEMSVDEIYVEAHGACADGVCRSVAP